MLVVYMHAFAIGGRDMVIGFRLVGVKGVVVSSPDEAWRILSKTVENIDIAVVIMSEEFSEGIRDKIDDLRLNLDRPLIVEIPGESGARRETDIVEITSKAIGVSL